MAWNLLYHGFFVLSKKDEPGQAKGFSHISLFQTLTVASDLRKLVWGN